MNIQDVRLDIDKSPSVGKWVTIGQGDKGGTTIVAHIFDHGVAATLTGMTARFEMRMPNATYFEDTNCTINGNVITYVVDESHAALYAGGESVAYFALYDGETAIYSTERFHVRVARAASDGANPGHAWTNGIEEWLDEASDTLDGYVADANSRVGATINAANAAISNANAAASAANTAANNANDKANEATSAANAANAAVTNANAAADGANQAAASANAAADAASTAAASVSEMVDDLESAIDTKASAIIETASGAIASFDDGADDMPVKKLVANIEPVQDLHGYDSPWPAGGGKNLLDINNIVVGNTNNWSVDVNGDTLTITHKTTYTSDIPTFAFNQPSGTYVMSMGSININGQISLYVNGLWAETINNGDTFTIDAANTNEIKFSAYENQETIITKLQIESGSTATTYAPYSNICPISGWTGAEIEQTGVNLFNQDVLTQYSGVVLNDDGSIYVSNNNYLFGKIAWENKKRYSGQIAITYRYKFVNTVSGGSYPIIFYTDGTSERLIVPVVQDFSTATLISNQSKTVDYVTFTYSSADNATTFFMQIAFGSTATTYEPYNGNQISVTFPSEAGTVYGGTLDVTTGLLTVTMAEVDLGTLNWEKYPTSGSNYWFRCALPVKAITGGDVKPNILCSAYATETANNVYTGKQGISQPAHSDSYVVVCDMRYSDVATFITAMSGVQLCYELATSVEYTLTENKMDTLYDTNNIWADTGDVEVTYPTDTKLYIDNKITQAIANALNS